MLPLGSSASAQTNTPSAVISSPLEKVGNITHIIFTLPLKRGSQNKEVIALQKFLSQNQSLYPEGSASGYFGPATERAIKRFQEKYLLAKIGDSGYGSVGPKTRAKMNSIQTP